MQAVNEGGITVYKSPWSLPGPVPDNVNVYSVIKAAGSDPRFAGSEPAFIDSVTGYSRTLPEQLERSENLGRALLQIPVIAASRTQTTPTTIGILSPNHIDYPTIVHAALQISVPFASMSSASKVLEVTHFIKSASVVAMIVHPSLIKTAVAACSNYERTIPIILTHPFQGLKYPSLPELVEQGKALPALPPPVVPPSELAWVVFSSGTTGLPKAVQITHKNVIALLASAKILNEVHQAAAIKVGGTPIFGPSERFVVLAYLPLYHAYGLVYSVIRPFLAPTTVIIMPGWNLPKAIELIEKYRVNFWTMVPTVAVQIVHSPLIQKADLSSVKSVLCGAAYLSPEMRTKLEDTLMSRGASTGSKGVKLEAGNGYGMSEVVVSCAAGTPEGSICGRSPHKAIGVTIPGLDVRIVDPETMKDVPLGSGEVGELWLRGPTVMKGYGEASDNEKAFVWEGGERWLRTGDGFRIDQDGWMWYVERLKEVFKSKGLQVTPSEIVGVINELPIVVDSAVAGMPRMDDENGDEEEAWAWIVLSGEGKQVGHVRAKQLVKEHVKNKLAKHKWVARVEIVDEIPAVQSGKKLTRELKKEALRMLEKKKKGKAKL